MKIALIGYGKMGHIIHEIAVARGHEIVCTIDAGEEQKFDSQEFASADAAIEFSIPTAAVANIKRCVAAEKPMVVGTTGWLDLLPEIANLCLAEGGKVIYGTNFSIGVNLFWAINKYMTKVMSGFPQYRPQLTETHHIHKLDHPSGTAVTTAEMMVEADPRLSRWEESEIPVADDVLNVRYRRDGEVPGIHTVEWISDTDTLTLSHSAASRRGFALGAVMAAEWIVGRPAALYSIHDMMADILAK